MRRFISLMVGSAILMAALFSYSGRIMSASAVKSHSPEFEVLSQAQLTAWYAAYNDRWFQNQLPKNTQVVWADLSDFGAMGATVWVGDHFVIALDPFYNVADVTTKETLLHESCHVYVESTQDVPPGEEHGPAFQTCMLNLATEGALAHLW